MRCELIIGILTLACPLQQPDNPAELRARALDPQVRLAPPTEWIGVQGQVRLEIPEERWSAFEFLRLEDGQESDGSALARVVDGETEFTLAPGDKVLVRFGSVETLELGPERTLLGGMLLCAGEEYGARPAAHQPYFSLSNASATWDAAAGAYTTRLMVGLESDPPGTPLPEGVEVSFRLELSGATALAQPNPIVLAANDLAKEVVLSCRRHEVAPHVSVASSFGKQEFGLELAPELSSVRIEPGQSRIAGWGLGATEITVRGFAEDGREWEGEKRSRVSLGADRGSLPVSVELGTSSSPSHVSLRSRGIGEDRIHVTFGQQQRESLVVTYEWPLWILLAAVIGGATGAWFQAWRTRRAKPSASQLRRRVIVGALAGLLGLVCVALGVRVAPISQAVSVTEAGAFFVGALAGISGGAFLPKLSKSLFG